MSEEDVRNARDHAREPDADDRRHTFNHGVLLDLAERSKENRNVPFETDVTEPLNPVEHTPAVVPPNRRKKKSLPLNLDAFSWIWVGVKPSHGRGLPEIAAVSQQCSHVPASYPKVGAGGGT